MFETDLRATLAGSIRTVCFTSIPDIGSRISISDIQSITGIDPRSGIWIDQTTDRDLIYNPQLQGGLIYLRSDLRYRYRFSDIDPSQISIPTDIQTSDDVAINIVNMPWGGDDKKMYFVPAEELETSANSRAQHYRQGGCPKRDFLEMLLENRQCVKF